MKRSLHRFLTLTSGTVMLLALTAPAQTPAGGTGSTTGAAGSAVQKAVASSDRKFVKDSTEQILAVKHLAEVTKYKGPGSEPLKKMNGKIVSDLDAAWGELGTYAQAHKIDLPKTEQSSAEKSDISRLKKTEADKFDKALLKAMDKETKKAAQIFEMADKTVQDPDLKTIAGKWSPKMKANADEVTAAEAAASQKK